MKDIVNEHEVI